MICLSIIGIILPLLSACKTKSPNEAILFAHTPTLTATQQTTPTLRPTPTNTPSPLGSLENPIKMGLIAPNPTQEQIENASQVLKSLADKTGKAYDVIFYEDFAALVSAIKKREIFFTWLSPLDYLEYRTLKLGEVSAVVNRFGVYQYGIQFLANQSRGFSSYFDVQTKTSTANPEQALAQFSGARPCFTEKNSLSGYLLPNGMLNYLRITVLEPSWTHSYTGTIKALYVEDICDYGVTYAHLSDPRTSLEIAGLFPDAAEKIEVIWQSDAIIPNLSLVMSSRLNLPLQQLITRNLVAIAKTETGRSQLSTALQYAVEDLAEFDDRIFDQLWLYVANNDAFAVTKTPTPSATSTTSSTPTITGTITQSVTTTGTAFTHTPTTTTTTTNADQTATPTPTVTATPPTSGYP